MALNKDKPIDAEKFVLALAALPTISDVAAFFDCEREDLLPLVNHEKVLSLLEKHNLTWSLFWQLGMNHLNAVLTEENPRMTMNEYQAQRNKNEAAKVFIKLAHDFRKETLKAYLKLWEADGEEDDPLSMLQKDLVEQIFKGKPDLSAHGRTPSR